MWVKAGAISNILIVTSFSRRKRFEVCFFVSLKWQTCWLLKTLNEKFFCCEVVFKKLSKYLIGELKAGKETLHIDRVPYFLYVAKTLFSLILQSWLRPKWFQTLCSTSNNILFDIRVSSNGVSILRQNFFKLSENYWNCK